MTKTRPLHVMWMRFLTQFLFFSGRLNDYHQVHDNLDSSGSIVGVLGRNVTTTLMARGSTNISVVSLKPLPSTAGNPDHRYGKLPIYIHTR